eukprot:UN00040
MAVNRILQKSSCFFLSTIAFFGIFLKRRFFTCWTHNIKISQYCLIDHKFRKCFHALKSLHPKY